MTRSSMVMMTPPWVAPQLFRSSGRLFSETTACSFVVSTIWMPRCLVKGMRISPEPSTVPSGGAYAAVDGDDLAGDVARSVRGEERDDALQVLFVAEPVQRG